MRALSGLCESVQFIGTAIFVIAKIKAVSLTASGNLFQSLYASKIYDKFKKISASLSRQIKKIEVQIEWFSLGKYLQPTTKLFAKTKLG